IFRGVDLEAGADGLAGLRRASATCGDGDATTRGNPNSLNEVLFSLRNDDAERFDLIDAGVGGVERPRDAVESYFALDRVLELETEPRHPARSLPRRRLIAFRTRGRCPPERRSPSRPCSSRSSFCRRPRPLS